MSQGQSQKLKQAWHGGSLKVFDLRLSRTFKSTISPWNCALRRVCSHGSWLKSGVMWLWQSVASPRGAHDHYLGWIRKWDQPHIWRRTQFSQYEKTPHITSVLLQYSREVQAMTSTFQRKSKQGSSDTLSLSMACSSFKRGTSGYTKLYVRGIFSLKQPCLFRASRASEALSASFKSLACASYFSVITNSEVARRSGKCRRRRVHSTSLIGVDKAPQIASLDITTRG